MEFGLGPAGDCPLQVYGKSGGDMLGDALTRVSYAQLLIAARQFGRGVGKNRHEPLAPNTTMSYLRVWSLNGIAVGLLSKSRKP